MRWVIRFTLTGVGAVLALLLLWWAAFGFGPLGLDAAGTMAAALGILVTSALGFGLIGLMIYSDRSGRDDAVGAKPPEQ